MENTQDHSASQYLIPADETARTDRQVNAPDASAAPETAYETEALLAEAQARATSLQEEFLRAKAETENVRRRAHEDVQKAYKFAIENFAQSLLPVIDSLEAALAHSCDDFTQLHEGIELTLRQLTGALEKGRVVEVNPVGEKFDPHRHQAISMVPAEQEANTVVSVLQKGYVIADRVLRPALVSVAASKNV
ncbi:nucleotide exchange factor GrpE [Caballeronia sp. LjRoot34]|uniref:nucleotide exchange factor GrpE n=1 Tax=Caballeronia sp. LjRoot34 TaxID=3342325 RepID=UPI003ED0B171